MTRLCFWHPDFLDPTFIRASTLGDLVLYPDQRPVSFNTDFLNQDDFDFEYEKSCSHFDFKKIEKIINDRLGFCNTQPIAGTPAKKPIKSHFLTR